jgi:hypothetical protein
LTFLYRSILVVFFEVDGHFPLVLILGHVVVSYVYVFEELLAQIVEDKVGGIGGEEFCVLVVSRVIVTEFALLDNLGSLLFSSTHHDDLTTSYCTVGTSSVGGKSSCFSLILFSLFCFFLFPNSVTSQLEFSSDFFVGSHRSSLHPRVANDISHS